MTQTTDTRDAEIAARKARALAIDCPFCAATAGQMCRARASGREKDWPHSRRIELAEPPDERYRPVQVEALCCVCGNLRTVNSDYHRHSDPNYARGDEGKRRGWRSTQTLKCQECAQGTRHAILPRADGSDYYDEKWQQYALGGAWEGNRLYAPDRDRIRAEYQQQFPRNPKLHHRFWVDQADKLRAAGETHMPALCGDSAEIPRSWTSTSESLPDWELRKPDDVDWDTEFEDPDTGMWWVDMECVNCLRVANDSRRVKQRQRLEFLLMSLSVHPEKIADDEVAAVLEYLERLGGNQTD